MATAKEIKTKLVDLEDAWLKGDILMSEVLDFSRTEWHSRKEIVAVVNQLKKDESNSNENVQQVKIHNQALNLFLEKLLEDKNRNPFYI
jgi:hypothetical protein